MFVNRNHRYRVEPHPEQWATRMKRLLAKAVHKVERGITEEWLREKAIRLKEHDPGPS